MLNFETYYTEADHSHLAGAIPVTLNYKLRPDWYSVCFALITPIGFSINACFMRFLALDLGFDPKRI